MGIAYPIGWPLGMTAAKLGIPTRVRINAFKDNEAGVFVGFSPDVRGLVLEADSLEGLLEEARLVLPDFFAAPEVLEHNDTQLRYGAYCYA